MKLTHGLAMLALSGAIGCGFDGRGVVASSAEYELYRQTRVSPTLDGRLRASWDYLQRYPDGEFRSDVRAWFQSAEADYFVAAGPSRVRLRRYLAVLPDGPHAVEARVRLAELEQAALVAEQKEAAVIERARAVGERLQQADLARKQFLEVAAGWVRRLAEPQQSRPRALVDDDFIRTFRNEAPAAVCDEQRCVKQLTMSYSIPDAGKTSDRVAVFDVILTFVGAGVMRGELMGPDLFSRLGEAAQRLAVPVDDGQRRAEAIGATEQLLAGVLEAHFPKSKCAGTPVSPVVLERICEGVRVQVIAALEVGSEDRVVIELIAAEAPAGYEAW